MKRQYNRLILIFFLITISIWINWPNNSGIHVGEFDRSLETILGLDLQGGMQVLLEVPEGFEVKAEDLDVARQILENRSNGLGVSEVTFQTAGARRIVGEFPGLTNTEQVIEVLKTTGQLEFVDLGDNYLQPGTTIKTDLGYSPESPAESVTTEDAATTQTPALSTDEDQLLSETGAPTTEEGDPEELIWPTVMTGDQIKNVTVSTDTLGDYRIDFELKEEGTEIFKEYTTNNINKILAIVLDNKIISSPRINSAIPKGQGSITGNFNYETANALAIQLRYGSLPIPLEEVETRVIGPTLGQDSLNKSMVAGIIGFIIITLFMLIYYRLPGFVAMLAIITYGFFTLAVYRLLPVTLTLPGIAGFLLSTGGALNANILIFERLKEELRLGRKLGQAVELSWKRAWPSIRDSNIATLITSAILFWFGSAYGASAVKGFALTLAIGVGISLFGAIVVTRSYMGEILKLSKPTNLGRWFGI
ncbi:MAG: protein translocase subunit SecD [Anaerolineaceae bacterium]|nr:protein translocase subunit SecD [Anaerolineaceae bacterium]